VVKVIIDGCMEKELAAGCLTESEDLLRAFLQTTKQLLGRENSPVTPIRMKDNTVFFTLIIIRVNDW
jgi:hypothetical protein